MNKQERFKNTAVEFRTVKDGGEQAIQGYAVKFNSRYDAGRFIETIASGAFSKVLASNPDIRFLINHDPNKILGRTKNGTLKIWQDSVGLCFRNVCPNTRDAQDAYALIERGDLSQCSFSFAVEDDGQTWSETDSRLGAMADPAADVVRSVPFRTITQVSELYDLSAVTFPAYEDTSVAIARALAEKEIYVPTPPIRSKAVRSLETVFITEDVQRWNLLAVGARKAMEAEICWRDKTEQEAQLMWSAAKREELLRDVRKSERTIKLLRSQLLQCTEQIQRLESVYRRA